MSQGTTHNIAGKRGCEAVGGWLAYSLGCLAVLGLSGCVEKVPNATHYTQSDMPKVVSGNPDRDSSALAESESQMDAVKWTVIERKGPRPIRQLKGDQTVDVGTGGRNYASGVPELKIITVPTTQPVAVAPSTQPTTQPAVTHEVRPLQVCLNESELPVRVIELQDGKLRIIWTLRNYGGAQVTSARDATTSRRTVAVAPPDLTPLVAVVQQHVGPAGTVLPLARENTVVVTCDKFQRVGVLELLNSLDVPPRQVEIAAKIFEVSHDFDFQTGANILAKRIGADNSQSVLNLFQSQRALDAGAGGEPFQGSVITLMKTFEKAGISVDAQFQILADEGLIKVVSSPRMTVASGQTGYLLAGQELPVQTPSYVNSLLQMGTQYKPVGVQLYITPQAVGPDRVKLHTISIVSSIMGFAPVPTITGKNPDRFFTNPIIESREAETAVTVQDGDTLVISGLRMVRNTTRENKVPGLGDVPVLGWLFKSHRSQQQMTDLYFFVTPTLL